MAEMLYKATKYMNVEDVMIARGDTPRKRERQDNPHPDRGRKSTQTNKRRDDRRSNPSSGRMINFTLEYPAGSSPHANKGWRSTDLAKQVKGNPSKRPRNKYCHFHWDHRHDTSKCYDLKQQIKALIKQGKLQQFVRGGENPSKDPKPNQWVKKESEPHSMK